MYEGLRQVERDLKIERIYNCDDDVQGIPEGTVASYLSKAKNGLTEAKKIVASDPYLSKAISTTGGTWLFKERLEKPPHVRSFCCAKAYLTNDFDPFQKQFYPVYLTLAVIILLVIREQSNSHEQKIASKVFALLVEDLNEGKFRNGIRVDDIYLCYGVVVNDSRDYFYSKILPKMEKKIGGRSCPVHKTLNRAGVLVWKLK